MDWYKKSADNGEMLANNALAHHYINNNDVEKAVTFIIDVNTSDVNTVYSTDIDGINGIEKSLNTLTYLLKEDKITDPATRKKVEAVLADERNKVLKKKSNESN